MLTRRSLFAALFAAPMAPLAATSVAALVEAMPAALPAYPPKFHREAFAFVTPPATLDEISGMYLRPAMIALANGIDVDMSVLWATRNRGRLRRLHLDPARLPL